MKATASLLVLCVCFVSIAGGCRKTGSSTATLSGKVLFKGEPLPSGLVTFHPKGEGGPISTGITEDGSYRVAIPFSGEASVTVVTAAPGTPDKGIGKNPGADPAQFEKAQKEMLEKMKNMPPEMQKFYKNPGGGAGKYVEIPKKYADPKSTPLTVTISGGSQVEDIKLEN